MVDLFLNRVLVENNWDQDQLNTEREIVGILENRITLLFFASATCQKCREFLPALNNFFKRLKDPAYIEYPKLLALIFIRSGFVSTLHTNMAPWVIGAIIVSVSRLQLGPIRGAAGTVPQRAAQEGSVSGL